MVVEIHANVEISVVRKEEALNKAVDICAGLARMDPVESGPTLYKRSDGEGATAFHRVKNSHVSSRRIL